MLKDHSDLKSRDQVQRPTSAAPTLGAEAEKLRRLSIDWHPVVRKEHRACEAVQFELLSTDGRN